MRQGKGEMAKEIAKDFPSLPQHSLGPRELSRLVVASMNRRGTRGREAVHHLKLPRNGSSSQATSWTMLRTTTCDKAREEDFVCGVQVHIAITTFRRPSIGRTIAHEPCHGA